MDRSFAALASLLALLLAAPAFAQYVGPGGSASSVKEILAHPVDDAEVTLRGRIVRGLGNDKYLFDDGTGEIRIDIDSDDFPPGRPISETTDVEIHGKVEKEFMRDTEIDVKRLMIVSNARP